MLILWSESLDGVDWEELAALYRAAPGREDRQTLNSSSPTACFAVSRSSAAAECRGSGSRRWSRLRLPLCRRRAAEQRAVALEKVSCRGCSSGRKCIGKSILLRFQGARTSIGRLDFVACARRWQYREPDRGLRARISGGDLRLRRLRPKAARARPLAPGWSAAIHPPDRARTKWAKSRREPGVGAVVGVVAADAADRCSP